MSTITFNHSKVTPDIHDQFMKFAVILGYTIVGNEQPENTIQSDPMTIPRLYPFEVPAGSTIASARGGIPKSHQCKENLTDENFPCELPKGPVAGGFLPMSRRFESQEAIDAIQKLSKKTGRRFRVGTALEFLMFWKKNNSFCPKYSVALGTKWNKHVLCCLTEYSGFDLGLFMSTWRGDCRVFLVEDL